jgi:hypothetical protein
VPPLVFAAQSSHVNVLVIALGLGFGIGVAGHLIRSRTLIVTGILIIGLTSSYVAFVLQPGG